jgi:hypothetical protein
VRWRGRWQRGRSRPCDGSRRSRRHPKGSSLRSPMPEKENFKLARRRYCDPGRRLNLVGRTDLAYTLPSPRRNLGATEKNRSQPFVPPRAMLAQQRQKAITPRRMVPTSRGVGWRPGPALFGGRAAPGYQLPCLLSRLSFEIPRLPVELGTTPIVPRPQKAMLGGSGERSGAPT